MSLTERLKTYSRPLDVSNWQGSSREMKNINRWSDRATRESDGYKHRAVNKEIELPGGGGVAGPSYGTLAGAGSGVGRIEHSHELARKDSNHVSGTHMHHVRRTTG